MPVSSSTELALTHRRRLLALAREAIEYGCRTGARFHFDNREEKDPLAEPRAVFVTLHDARGALRGCIGTLAARYPLGEAVVTHAHQAAFEDPRFAPVVIAETRVLEIEISVLSPPSPLPARTESDLLEALAPGLDGLILAEGARTATFLPQVWEQLSDPRAFLTALKRKASLPGEYWSETIAFARYRALRFREADPGGLSP